MNDSLLLRISGGAAIAGGGLRIADSVLPKFFPAENLGSTYFVTDVFLLAGLLGIYFSRRLVLGWVGLAAFAIAAIGLLIVRSDSVRFFGFGGYALGAPMALVGTVLLGVALAVNRQQRVAAGLWLAAFAIGIAGTCCEAIPRTIDAAGVLFGLGFVAAGIYLMTERAASQMLD